METGIEFFHEGLLMMEEPNKITYAAIDAAEKGEDMYGPFDSAAELMDALNTSTTDFG